MGDDYCLARPWYNSLPTVYERSARQIIHQRFVEERIYLPGCKIIIPLSPSHLYNKLVENEFLSNPISDTSRFNEMCELVQWLRENMGTISSFQTPKVLFTFVFNNRHFRVVLSTILDEYPDFLEGGSSFFEFIIFEEGVGSIYAFGPYHASGAFPDWVPDSVPQEVDDMVDYYADMEQTIEIKKIEEQYGVIGAILFFREVVQFYRLYVDMDIEFVNCIVNECDKYEEIYYD